MYTPIPHTLSSEKNSLASFGTVGFRSLQIRGGGNGFRKKAKYIPSLRSFPFPLTGVRDITSPKWILICDLLDLGTNVWLSRFHFREDEQFFVSADGATGSRCSICSSL